MTFIHALTRAVPVSMEPNLLSPIVRDMILAPGDTPLRSGSSGTYPAAIAATCVPWEAKIGIGIFKSQFYMSRDACE